jgi:hypothetical protein
MCPPSGDHAGSLWPGWLLVSRRSPCPLAPMLKMLPRALDATRLHFGRERGTRARMRADRKDYQAFP